MSRVTEVKKAVSDYLQANGFTGLDELRGHVAKQLNQPSTGRTDESDLLTYRAAQAMVRDGLLVRVGKGTRYNAIKYYTQAKWAEVLANREAAKQAEADLRAAWVDVRDRLQAAGIDALLDSQYGRVRLSLTGWREVLARLEAQR